jgi:exodeoxyribonuclease VIII
MSFQNAKIKSVGANPVEYHSHPDERGNPAMIVSSSMLREFGACPARWRAGYLPPSSDAKDYGSLLDCLLLTPDDFEKRFVVQPETYTSDKGEVKKWSNNATSCKEWNAVQLERGREIVVAQDLNDAHSAVARLRADFILSDFIDASDKQVWVTGEWLDAATGLIIPCQALLDFRPREDTEYFQRLGDLKTTRCAGVRQWQSWSSSRGYHVQAAFYTDLYNAATGEKRNDWCFVIQENFAPWQTARRILSRDKLKCGRTIYQGLMARYCKALQTDKWPDYDDTPAASQGWTPDELMPWEEGDAFMQADIPDPEWMKDPLPAPSAA